MSPYSGESGHRAEADSIIDRIHAVLDRNGIDVSAGKEPKTLNWDDPDDRRLVRRKFDNVGASEALLPGFGETGHGENARDDCGNPHPFVCDSCGSAVEFGRTCSQSVCTRCGVAWCRDLSIKKSAKVRRVRKEKHYHTPDAEHQKIHHQIISPALGWYYDLARAGYSLDEAQDLTQNIVKDILDEMRAQGVLVRHSYRGAHDDGSIRSESDDRGAWKQRLNSDRSWVGDVRDDLAWKPHYHGLVVSDWLELKGDGDDPGLAERVEDATGWVIHRIEDDDGISLANDGAMARATTYCLSHCDIDVNEDGHNRSAVWEVGSFSGDAIKSSSRFTARSSDLEWADSVVRRVAQKTLGIRSGTTDCGAQLPGVDDPDEFARRIIEDLYPDDDRPARNVSCDAVLYHVSEGNINVDVSTTEGGGGDVTVRDAWGEPIGADGFAGNLPDAPGPATFDGADAPVATIVNDDRADDADDCDCGGDHGDSDADPECDGQLIPLGEARQRGLLEDDEWCRDAPHVDEAREVDLEWPDDLVTWRTASPGKAIGAG